MKATTAQEAKEVWKEQSKRQPLRPSWREINEHLQSNKVEVPSQGESHLVNSLSKILNALYYGDMNKTEIRKVTGLHKNTVDAAMELCKAKGLVSVQTKRHNAHVYSLDKHKAKEYLTKVWGWRTYRLLKKNLGIMMKRSTAPLHAITKHVKTWNNFASFIERSMLYRNTIFEIFSLYKSQMTGSNWKRLLRIAKIYGAHRYHVQYLIRKERYSFIQAAMEVKHYPFTIEDRRNIWRLKASIEQPRPRLGTLHSIDQQLRLLRENRPFEYN